MGESELYGLGTPKSLSMSGW